jgi:hypothetical protein
MYILFPAPDFNKMGLYSIYIVVLADARDCCFFMNFLSQAFDKIKGPSNNTGENHTPVSLLSPFCQSTGVLHMLLEFQCFLHQRYRICVVQNIDLFVEITNRGFYCIHIIYFHESISHAPAHGKEESKSNPYKINTSCFEFHEEAVCVSP